MTTVETIGSVCGRFATKAVRALSATAAMLAVCALLPVWGDEPETTRIQFMDDTYLQGDGYQLIDIDYHANFATKVVMDYEVVNTNYNSQRIFFFGGIDEAFSFGMYKYRSSHYFAYGNDNNNFVHPGTSVQLKEKTRYTATLDSASGNMSISSGGKTLYSGTMNEDSRTHTSDKTMKIFSGNGSSLYGFKLYSFAVYDDGELVRDLIPYGRGAVTGLLDKCSGKVYTNTKTGTVRLFAIGTDDGYVSAERGNAQCLDTGYTANPQSKVEIDFSLTDAVKENQCVFSTGYGDSTLALYVNAANKFAWACQDDTTAWDDAAIIWHDTGIAADGARRTFAIDVPNGMVALVHGDGTTNYTAVIDAPPTKNASYSLKMFMDATTHTGRITGINPASVRLYGLKIHDGAELKRDYSPRLVDNVPGIYDAVTGVFTNSVSSKGLHFGGDLACVSGAAGLGGNADAYLEFSGSQSIDTGYVPKRTTRLVVDYGIFAYWTVANYFFGAEDARKLGLYYNGTVYSYYYPDTKYNKEYAKSTGVPYHESRYNVDIDLSKTTDTAIMTDGSVTKNQSFANLRDTLGVGSLRIGSKGDGRYCSIFRLYSFAIYEGGDLVHYYTPCATNGVIGLWDSCEKVFKPDTQGNASYFRIGGAGVNGGGMAFLEQPQGCVVKRDQTAVLSAYAPGAVGYQWLKNGEIVEGATGPTLEVSYGASRKADTYRCISHYAVFGYGVSEEAVVEKQRDGMRIILR